VHVPVPGLETGANLRHTSTVQPTGHLDERDHRMMQQHQTALHRVQARHVGTARIALEDALFHPLELLLQRGEHREVTIDDRVHQGIEHEAGALPQQRRLALATLTHAEKGHIRMLSYREHEVGPDEDGDLPELQILLTVILEQMHHHEEGIAVLLHLRALVAMTRVLHGQRMQAELLLHDVELLGGRVLQGHPQQASLIGAIVRDVPDRDVGLLAAIAVHHAVEQHQGTLGVLASGQG